MVVTSSVNYSMNYSMNYSNHWGNTLSRKGSTHHQNYGNFKIFVCANWHEAVDSSKKYAR